VFQPIYGQDVDAVKEEVEDALAGIQLSPATNALNLD
jgi:hypothetical protein